jgi:pyruvate dehydrogenase (quinone)
MTATVADVLLRRLRDWGVKQVFGYPGDGINGLLAAWGRADNDPQFVQSRHEEMAAFEAVGYAKFSGKVGVCAATPTSTLDAASTASTSSANDDRFMPC